jgi:hypothetical protein
LKHFSPGNPNRTWIEDCSIICQKFGNGPAATIRPLKADMAKDGVGVSYKFMLHPALMLCTQ